MALAPEHPLRAGEAAPNFRLPAVHRDGVVTLDDYLGKSAVMIGLFRGLHCPFCRRHIARLGLVKDRLAQRGVATLAVVNTQLDRARQYFQYRPTRMDLATDPDVRTHRAYGVIKLDILPDDTDPRALQWPRTCTVAQLLSTSINPTGELPEQMNLMAAMETLNGRDGFEDTEVDKQVYAQYGTQFNSHFLIDADGIIRWSYVEADDNANQLGSCPGDDEMLEAAKALGS